MPTPPSPYGQPATDFYSQLFINPQDRASAEGGALNWHLRNLGATTTQGVQKGAATSLPIGYANLASILASQGKTDPMRLNQQLSDISRGTQAQQTNIQELFARAGLGGSGLMPAVVAAQGAAGNQQRSQAIAQENQIAEARRRADLDLLYNLIIGPSLQGIGIERGYQSQQNINAAQQKGAYAMALANLIGGVVPG